jgi:hypothetical protein
LSIYVRPVREQIEHDRVIRFLQAKLKRKYDVAANVGAEQAAASVKAGTQLLFPDLVLTGANRKLAGVIEVETGESVHHLEAMAQWAPFGRLKVPFHLYVPVASADIARRLAGDLGAHITELWSFHAIGDQIRLTLVQKTPVPGEARRQADRERAAEKRAARPAPKKPAKAPSKTTKTPPAARSSKSAKAGKAKSRAPKPAPRRPAPPARKPARRAAAKRK